MVSVPSAIAGIAPANGVSVIAPTIVTGDRVSNLGAIGTSSASNTGNAVYNLGQSEFAQVLNTVQPTDQVIQALKDNGDLATPADSTLATLIQAAAQQTPSSTSPQLGIATLQQALQNGGQQLLQASRLGLNLNTTS
ncbi:MAG TPA: hypothetical protein VMB81_16985 [Candidatus Sulfotelmatobacter sp.]|nr:hypothetical protein [Candidatus Sulfotelmatobacter sp.]